MRLIDADEFIKKFKYASADTEDQKIMCATVRRMIKEQPTAYYVDTVVNQLEEYGEELERFGCSSILSDMIEVVRVGGFDA